MRHAAPIAVLSLALVLSGCFTLSSIITVRPDGTATVRDSVAFSGVLASLMQEEGAADALSSEGNLEARAQALGDGVTVERFEISETGYVAVYAVPDVRELRYYAPNPGFAEEETVPSGDPDMLTTFLFEDGDPATLRAIVHKPTETKPTPGDDAPDDMDGLLDGVADLFGDARVSVSLRVEGEVVETTAAYADGSEIVLLDLPFSALIESADVFAQVGGARTPTADAYAALNGIDGVRVQPPGTVRVRFR